jgi:hypothetical protein
MFRGSLGGIIATLAIPAAQICVLYLVLSGVTVSAAPVHYFLAPTIGFGAGMAVLLLWISNMILWAKFSRDQNFGLNALVSAVVPALPAFAVGWISGHPDGIGVFAVAYLVPFCGYLLIAVLTAYGSTGRGLTYDLGLMVDD